MWKELINFWKELIGFFQLLITLWQTRKEVNYNMAIVYATLIINDKRTFMQVPITLREKVRQVLIDLEMEHLIIEE